MSIYDLTLVSKQALQQAVSTASQPFLGMAPTVAAEMVDGSDCSFLHITVDVPATIPVRRPELRRAVVEASLSTRPTLGVPVVTLRSA
jgi:hypothetical protein